MKKVYKKEKLIGILGGMGPEATASFFSKIIKNTPVKKDQDHLRILIYNNPKIPDRTRAILGRGINPRKALVDTALFLEKSGVDFLSIPCVSSHYYYDDIQEQLNIPVLHIIKETLTYIKFEFKHITQIGLLATSGTIHSRLFQGIFEKDCLTLIIPTEKDQSILMEAIYGKQGIKAGITTEKPKNSTLNVINNLIESGAEAIIGGCTELPLIINADDLTVPFLDTLDILAKATVKEARK